MHFQAGLRSGLADCVGNVGQAACLVVAVQPSLDADFKRSRMATNDANLVITYLSNL